MRTAFCGARLAIMFAALALSLDATAAATGFATEASFIAATAPNAIAHFEDVPVNQGAPFASAQVSFPTTSMGVIDSLVSLPQAYRFGSAGSAPNFAVDDVRYAPAPDRATEVPTPHPGALTVLAILMVIAQRLLRRRAQG